MNIKSSFYAFSFFNKLNPAKNYRAFCLALLSMVFLAGCAAESQIDANQPDANQIDTSHINLFDGKSLGKWQVSDFFEAGNIYVKDGSIYIEKSKNRGYMQGIRWTGPLIKMNYEITLDSMIVEGSDFFCGLTFPVGEKPCTLILGGWGGTLCGLSSLDNMDASENETTTLIEFKQKQWYHIRLKVMPNRIQAWLDEKPLVDVDTTGRDIGIRFECEPSLPLGIATYETTSAIRDIKVQKIEE